MFCGAECAGWSEDRKFGGPLEGEILFDKIYFQLDGKRVQVGAVRRVGFDRAEVFETLTAGEQNLVGSVDKEGVVRFSDGREAGRVSQDVWSEMTSNLSGAALLLLACDPAFVARARGGKIPPKPPAATQIPVPSLEREEPGACRESHVFGQDSAQTESKRPSGEVCRDSHVFGAPSAHDPEEDEESEEEDSEDEVTGEAFREGPDGETNASDFLSQEMPGWLPPAEQIFSFGQPQGLSEEERRAREEREKRNRRIGKAIGFGIMGLFVFVWLFAFFSHL